MDSAARATQLPLTTAHPPARLLVWADAEQAHALAGLAATEHAVIQAVASPLARDVHALADALACDGVSDVRQGLVRTDIDAVLLASTTALDDDLVALLEHRRIPVWCTSYPGEGLYRSDLARFPYMFIDSAGVKAASEALIDFARPLRMLTLRISGPRAAMPLAMQLLDATHLVHGLLPALERVHAVATCSLNQGPQCIAEISGSCAISAITIDGVAVSVAANESGNAIVRELVISGAGGSLAIDDAGYTLHDAEGALVDEHRDAAMDAADVIASAISSPRAMRRSDRQPRTEISALMESIRLSMLTGDSKRPAAILEILARV
ncbi:MAG: hypothetical protein ACR2GY_10635 [Phycisphaerales bacterium]